MTQKASSEITPTQRHLKAMSNLPLHAPPDWQKNISMQDFSHLLAGGDQTGVHVVVGDIRGSTLLMREAVSSREYATITTSFADQVKTTAQDTGAWFDKFTGDGFIAYWIYGTKPSLFLKDVVTFCRRMHSTFEETVLPEHRKNARNVPVHVGLALGIDSGRCAFEEVAGDFTIIGHAVVGAVRMGDAAMRGETLCNIRMGQALSKEPSVKNLIALEQRIVKTKEYPEHGQEAYSIMFA